MLLSREKSSNNNSDILRLCATILKSYSIEEIPVFHNGLPKNRTFRLGKELICLIRSRGLTLQCKRGIHHGSEKNTWRKLLCRLQRC